MSTDPRRHSVDDRSMGGMLRWAATQHPDRDAIICGDTRGVGGSSTSGPTGRRMPCWRWVFGPDRVGLYFTNHPDYLALYLARPRPGSSRPR